MGPSDYKTYGWTYTLLGFGLFASGMGSLLDSNSPRILLGAIAVGPILFFRGVYFLREYYRTDWPQAMPPAASAAELYAGEIRRGSSPKRVTCENCTQAYVYFPGPATEVQAASLGAEVASVMAAEAVLKDRAVAPCPKCGWIQPSMRGAARAQLPMSLLDLAGLLMLFGSLFLFIYLIFFTGSDERKPEKGDTTPYLLAAGALLLVGVGLMVRGVIRHRRWDPNCQPVETRLPLGQQVSLPAQTYEDLVRSKGKPY